jgi:uncharacterized membrane protein
VASGFSRKDNRGVIAIVAPLVAALAASWAALLVAAPYLPVPLAAFLYMFGSVICHQLPDRSFHLDGAQLPVCARCFGIYAGGAVAALAACRANLVRFARWEAKLLLAAAVPTVLTVLLEWTGVHSSNLARAAAGTPLGAVVALIVMAAVRAPALHYEPCPPTRPTGFSPPAPPI